jgi:fatty-acyl-CoA synthase
VVDDELPVGTIADLVRARAGDDRVGLRFEDSSWTYRELVAGCAQRAALLTERRVPGRPFHVGVLLDNVPEFWLTLGACAVAGATAVGLNTTRRGAELARDAAHTDVGILVTETAQDELLHGADLGVAPERVFVVDTPAWEEALAPHAGASLPEVEVSPADVFSLIFTSGTTGAPKAVLMGHGRLYGYAARLATMLGLTADDVGYSVMPLFHSNAQVAGYANLLFAGATTVLRRRFSASAFVDDVRRYGVTWFNYVGKPLSYVLATPERPDDADNSLRFAFGNEATPVDAERFGARFGCYVFDGYGSTEGGVNMTRTPDTPRGALGVPAPGLDAAVYDAETMKECPRARFDERGRLLNADDAIGEIVNPDGPGGFEGYYNNPEANEARTRGGMYWTGDLGYRDADGFFYFAGRNSDWLRVDGENFGASQVETVLARHPDVVLASVYAVPAVDVGDDVMAALLLADGAAFDPDGFVRFLGEQLDLSPKWVPRFVRVVDDMPQTQTLKVLKRVLRAEGWDCAGEVWWRADPRAAPAYAPMTDGDRARLRDEFDARGRGHLLGRG